MFQIFVYASLSPGCFVIFWNQRTAIFFHFSQSISKPRYFWFFTFTVVIGVCLSNIWIMIFVENITLSSISGRLEISYQSILHRSWLKYICPKLLIFLNDTNLDRIFGTSISKEQYISCWLGLCIISLAKRRFLFDKIIISIKLLFFSKKWGWSDNFISRYRNLTNSQIVHLRSWNLSYLNTLIFWKHCIMMHDTPKTILGFFSIERNHCFPNTILLFSHLILLYLPLTLSWHTPQLPHVGFIYVIVVTK